MILPSLWNTAVNLLSLSGKAAPAGHIGGVSSESELCSQIGIDLLKRGGNAADAMVGTTLCVGTVGMQHSGIGGGGFALVRDVDGNFESIDFRETAPAAAHEDMFTKNPWDSVFGGLASGVPGDVKGLEYLHQKYGKLPWRAVCNPAVHVARHGFRVTEDLVRYMDALITGPENFLIDDPQFAIDFAPNGILVKVGDTMTRKRYADTLEAIAKFGSIAFYEGEIANATINALQAANGTMTLSDLANYTISTRKAISINYRNFTIHSTPSPSGGSVALSILKIIEGYDISSPASDAHLTWHRLDEAMRFSFGARAELGDPDFFDYIDDFELSMINETTAAGIRGRIFDDRTQKVSAYNPKRYQIPENHGTSHIVATDGDGLTISLTSTVNLLFGSRVVVPETGVIMNNEMNDFSIPGHSNEFGFAPSPINFIRPFKRPLSSITPIIVTHPNGTLYLTIGAAGGSRIITSTMQAVWHVLDHGMTLPEALAQGRIHDQLLPDQTTFEEGFDGDIVEDLKRRGHKITFVGGHQSAVQGVRRLWDGGLEAGSEPRQLNSGGLVA